MVVGIEQVVDLLACPHCADALRMGSGGRDVRCERGHGFDLARQGYLNLSSGPQPANADTPAMVGARERFLAAGFFDPITESALRLATLDLGASVLDAGAGTGRLLAAVLGGTSETPLALINRGIALDVSTAAARRAAQLHPRMAAVVADVWRRLPLRAEVVDLVISNFAPRNAAEFARVLRVGGRLLTISPTAEHLTELRRTYGLLDIQPAKADRLTASLSGLFSSGACHTVRRHDLWPAQVVADAIAMGPNAFHPDVGRPDPAPAEVTISVELRLWSRDRR